MGYMANAAAAKSMRVQYGHLGNADPPSVCGVYNNNDSVGVLVVGLPGGPQIGLAPQIPHLHPLSPAHPGAEAGGSLCQHVLTLGCKAHASRHAGPHMQDTGPLHCATPLAHGSNKKGVHLQQGCKAQRSVSQAWAHLEREVLVLYLLYIAAYCGAGGDSLAKVELVCGIAYHSAGH